MSNEMKIDDWLSCIPSKQTRKCYKAGIKKFELYYKQPVESLLNLNDEELGHIIEKFYAYLTDNNVCQNTKRNVVNCTVQYLKYFGKNPKYRKALGIYKTVESTKDKKLLIGDIQELAKVSDLREQVLLETLLLGLRISDVSVLEWSQFTQDEFTITTRKEQVTAHIFISQEFRELLNLYLPALDKSNKYLFQSAKNLHLTTKHIDYTLKHLAKRAGLQDWERFHWHLGRKLVLRTSAELGLSMWSAKMIVGKSIPSSDSTYLHGTDLKEDFMKLSKVLTLKPSNGNGKVTKLEEVVNSLEKENSIFKTRIDLLQKNQTEQSKKLEEFEKVFVNRQVEFFEKMIKRFAKNKGLDQKENYELLKEICGVTDAEIEKEMLKGDKIEQ